MVDFLVYVTRDTHYIALCLRIAVLRGRLGATTARSLALCNGPPRFGERDISPRNIFLAQLSVSLGTGVSP